MSLDWEGLHRITAGVRCTLTLVLAAVSGLAGQALERLEREWELDLGPAGFVGEINLNILALIFIGCMAANAALFLLDNRRNATLGSLLVGGGCVVFLTLVAGEHLHSLIRFLAPCGSSLG